MTILYYGDGKGKTTAALGLALRAAGAGKKVLILQFLKAQESSEVKAIKGVKNIQIKVRGEGFYRIMGDKQSKELHLRTAYQAYSEAKAALINQKYQVIIVDEILDVIEWKLISENKIIDLIRKKPKNVTLVLTGHKVSKKIIRYCDLVSEMKKIKHPYDKGVGAIKGIDF